MRKFDNGFKPEKYPCGINKYYSMMSDDQLKNIKKLLKDVDAKIEKSKEIARLKGSS